MHEATARSVERTPRKISPQATLHRICHGIDQRVFTPALRLDLDGARRGPALLDLGDWIEPLLRLARAIVDAGPIDAAQSDPHRLAA